MGAILGLGLMVLDDRAEIVDWVETYVFNPSQCFAVFPAGA